jgi:hypothetical protein
MHGPAPQVVIAAIDPNAPAGARLKSVPVFAFDHIAAMITFDRIPYDLTHCSSIILCNSNTTFSSLAFKVRAFSTSPVALRFQNATASSKTSL